MQRPVLNPQKPLRLPTLTSDDALKIVWESAVESVVNAFLILVFGSVALGLVGGIWRNMTPSQPPGFVRQPEAEATEPHHFRAWGAPLVEHRFLILSGLLFVLTLYFRFAGSRNGEESRTRLPLERIGNNLTRRWFGLVVVNAFGAMLAATIVTALARFTPSKMLLGWLITSALGELRGIVGWFFGPGGGNTFQAWLNWYGYNQLKFTFWFFYLAAICDDLGVPNFKALYRWLKRRYWHPSLHKDQPSR